MEELLFNKSAEVSIGIELEFQLIDPKSFSLISRATDVLEKIKESKYELKIKPELTQSMIEINSTIHYHIKELYKEVHQLYKFLLQQSSCLNISFCGGGLHPFQKWTTQNILLNKENRVFAEKYKFLVKRATVFGQHIHVGCSNGEDALYLTHALSRFVPHFIALSAASPFYQGIDTEFDSARSTIFSAFPLSGVIPFILNWNDFSHYFYKMRKVGVVTNMGNFLWDIRPHPDFGTVEIRVCDTPLTLKKAILIAAYIQTLSLYLLEERPVHITEDLYYLYNFNRFQASRYGFNGKIIDSHSKKPTPIDQDILRTIEKIDKYTQKLKNQKYIKSLIKEVKEKNNDANKLREVFKSENSLQKVVLAQCEDWVNSAKELRQSSLFF